MPLLLSLAKILRLHWNRHKNGSQAAFFSKLPLVLLFMSYALNLQCMEGTYSGVNLNPESFISSGSKTFFCIQSSKEVFWEKASPRPRSPNPKLLHEKPKTVVNDLFNFVDSHWCPLQIRQLWLALSNCCVLLITTLCRKLGPLF